MLECLQSIEISAAVCNFALFQLLQEFGIICRITENCHTGVVFCCSSDQSNPSNIDFLYSLWDRDIDLRDCIFKRVKVADNIVDLVDILFCEVFLVGCKVAGEDTGMNLYNC